jgi:hypothetical protein
MVYNFIILIFVFIIVFLVCYFSGVAKGKKQMEIKQNEESLRKAEKTIRYNHQKEKIKQEVFSDAEARISELDAGGSETCGGNTGSDRFNRINDVLRSKPEDRY